MRPGFSGFPQAELVAEGHHVRPADPLTSGPGRRGGVQATDLDVAIVDLGRLDLQRDAAAHERPGLPRLLVDLAHLHALVHDLAVEDVRGAIPLDDDLARVPALELM